MGIATTTPTAIRAALVTAIEGMTPSATLYQDVGWRYRAEGRISGPELRTFTILHTPATEDLEGIHGGDGIGFRYDTTIRVAYGGLTGDEADELIWSDGRDLWLLLHPLPDGGAGSVAGLLPFREGYEIELESPDDGYQVADFILPTFFKAAD
jgi:hypothetical protein